MGWSVKPGRGPSGMGVVGSVVAAVFGVFWTVTAFSMINSTPASMAPPVMFRLFPFFGVLFVILAIVGGFYNLYNATSRRRMSMLDVVDSREEPDPFDPAARSGPAVEARDGGRGMGMSGHGGAVAFCPYCGAETRAGFAFCPRCGKAIPGSGDGAR